MDHSVSFSDRSSVDFPAVVPAVATSAKNNNESGTRRKNVSYGQRMLAAVASKKNNETNQRSGVDNKPSDGIEGSTNLKPSAKLAKLLQVLSKSDTPKSDKVPSSDDDVVPE